MKTSSAWQKRCHCTARQSRKCCRPARLEQWCRQRRRPLPHPPPLEPAGGAAANSRQHESRTIRVDAERLGQLITLVGELIIASARTQMIGGRFKDADLQDSTLALAELVEQVRDSALQLRMVKIGATFNRFQRVVHDVAREIGKDIRLVLSGEEVELDKTLVERIGDPLTHLVRNAIDHGIEAPEVRRQRGKPLQGTVSLNAFHDSGSIVIEVGDDGGGLQRERIVASAIERGLLEPEHRPSDSEVFALIFEPGFSTASAVTSLSGRGVGMDVVKRNIEALRGSITIDSEAGRGTTVRVRLPLTLAIMDCMLVTVGSSRFAIPLGAIEECVEYEREGERGFVDLRGEVLPTAALRELFRLHGATPRRESVLVVRHAGQRAGLVVDGLQGTMPGGDQAAQPCIQRHLLPERVDRARQRRGGIDSGHTGPAQATTG